MTEKSMLGRVKVEGLFGFINHDIVINNSIGIIYAPNGYGKTTVFGLINATFSQRFDFLFKTIFKKLIVEESNGAAITITKHRDNKGEKGREILRFTFLPRPGALAVSHDINLEENASLARRLSEIEVYVPSLQRIGGREWLDRETSEILGFEQVITKYADYLPSRLSERFNYKLPESIKIFLEGINVRFIQTQRLLLERAEQVGKTGKIRRPSSMVSLAASDLSSLISQALSRYANESQKLDSSFPRRLIETRDDGNLLNYQTIYEDLRELNRKRDNLVKLGLIDKSQELISIYQPEQIKGFEKELSIYIKDSETKLSQFDNLLSKVALFQSIINSKFQFKSIEIEHNSGFILLNRNKQPLSLDSLSSGEQHELVMLYDMIFRTDDRTLLLIDEPEISLHVAWQHRFLEDLNEIRKVNKFNVLIATHSPQIIQNKWELTIDMGEAEIDA